MQGLRRNLLAGRRCVGVGSFSRSFHAAPPAMPADRRDRRIVFRRYAAAAVPLVVVLDMDECLIHSTGFSSGPDGLRQHEDGRPQHVDAEGVDSFPLELSGNQRLTVLKRPGLDDFLAKCCACFETYVFTAGTEAYARPLLDTLDSQKRLAGRFYRSDCTRVRTRDGSEYYLKDLVVVAKHCGREADDLARIVLVDNNHLSFVCQPRNGIIVPDFVGVPDDILPKVMQLLLTLGATDDDVRPKLDSMFALEEALKDVRKTLLETSNNSSRL